MNSPFDTSPDEILVEIFEYLDGSSLKEAALVCKRWSDIIGFSSKFMQKYVLTIASSENRDLSVVSNFRRKVVNVKVDLRHTYAWNIRPRRKVSNSRVLRNYPPIRDPAYNGQLVRAFERIGMNITHFTLERSKLDRIELTSMFRSMPELIVIILSEVDIIESRKKGQQPTLLLEKLKYLVASYSTWSVMDIIRAPNLTYLEISGLRNSFHAISFRSFIDTAANLETLIICAQYGYVRRWANSPIFDCKNFLVFYETLGSIDSMHLQQLKTLEIGSITALSWRHFCKFLSGRYNTLNKLTLSMHWGYINDRPREAFERLFHVVFGELKCLKVLTLGSVLQGCPNDPSLFDKLSTSIDDLTLNIYFEFSQFVFERILGSCRGITSLQINELTQDGARFIAKNLKLANLTVQQVLCHNMHFPTLKVFEISLNLHGDWQNFLRINGNIQTATFMVLSEPQALLLVEFIINETNVKNLSVKTVAPINAHLYRRILDNPKGLQTLNWIFVDGRRGKASSLLLKLPLNRDLEYLCSSDSKKRRISLQSWCI